MPAKATTETGPALPRKYSVKQLMAYFPHTDQDRDDMLEALGLDSIEELFTCIPEEIRLGRDLDLPKLASEPEIIKEMGSMAARNARMDNRPSFLGAGSYRAVLFGNDSTKEIASTEFEVRLPRPNLRGIRNADGTLTLSFEGKLEHAPTVNGPWRKSNISSPLRITPTSRSKFFRATH